MESTVRERSKTSRNYTVAVTSTAWVYQNVNVNTNAKTQELPKIVTIDNTSEEDVMVKFMNSDEGNAADRTGIIVAKNQSKTFEIEEDKGERPVFRTGIRLVAGSTAITIYVSCQDYILERV